MRAHLLSACAGLLLFLAGAVGTDARGDGRLYADLGGADGVTALVDQFLWNLAEDRRVNHFFVETKLERFRSKLIEHICMLAGGPCSYSGDSMHQVHGGLGIDEADFNAVVEDLIEAMESRALGTGTQNRLLALLAPMHGEIVERR